MSKVHREILQLNSISPSGKTIFFGKAGQVILQIDDPKIIEKLEVMRDYFMDFTPVPVKKVKAKE